VMARISSEVRFCLAIEPSVAEAVNRINSGFCRSGWDDKFVTSCSRCSIRLREELTLVNAGHMPPLFAPRLRQGRADRDDDSAA